MKDKKRYIMELTYDQIDELVLDDLISTLDMLKKWKPTHPDDIIARKKDLKATKRVVKYYGG